MQNPLSILGQLLVSPFRLGLGYLENRLLLKHRALLFDKVKLEIPKTEHVPLGEQHGRALKLALRQPIVKRGWDSEIVCCGLSRRCDRTL